LEDLCNTFPTIVYIFSVASERISRFDDEDVKSRLIKLIYCFSLSIKEALESRLLPDNLHPCNLNKLNNGTALLEWNFSLFRVAAEIDAEDINDRSYFLVAPDENNKLIIDTNPIQFDETSLLEITRSIVDFVIKRGEWTTKN
jgi:hypothetical protein